MTSEKWGMNYNSVSIFSSILVWQNAKSLRDKGKFLECLKIKDQRTNGPVNAPLISWPRKAQNIQNLENIGKRNDLDLQYSHTFIYTIRCLLLLAFRSLAAIVSEKIHLSLNCTLVTERSSTVLCKKALMGP